MRAGISVRQTGGGHYLPETTNSCPAPTLGRVFAIGGVLIVLGFLVAVSRRGHDQFDQLVYPIPVVPVRQAIPDQLDRFGRCSLRVKNPHDRTVGYPNQHSTGEEILVTAHSNAAVDQLNDALQARIVGPRDPDTEYAL